MADRQAQRAELQAQWDSLDDLTARLGQRVRERPTRDAEEGPGHLPDPNVAQELILTRGRLAAVEKERDRLARRLEATREKLRMARTELRRDKRQLERLAEVLTPGQQAAPAGDLTEPAPAQPQRLHVVHEEPEPGFEGAPLPEEGMIAELTEAVAQLDDMAAVLTAAEAELSQAAGVAAETAEAPAEPDQPAPEAPRPVHWSARALFDRISARWRTRGPG